ncbi:MAG TPA: peptidoglycan DD-metalloendopeptidase family protein [Anaerolineales bacterium]|nr:peptidoglycan DD-metalloendopeptidase family protein [Anaerolineales bacterium]
MRNYPPRRLLLPGLLLLLSACTIEGAAADPVPTGAHLPTASAAAPAEPTHTSTPHQAPPPTATATTAPPVPTSTLPAPLPDFPLQLPIHPPGRITIDPTYRFGTTQDGLREPHHGVEFLNSQGTPIYAAGPGTVLFAGDDYDGGPYSPANWFAFYGLFAVVEHDLPGYYEPVYTLYAHLFELTVETGQTVNADTQIGLIGFTGAAIGSHLHFEVRYGGTSYADSQNPENWLAPREGHGTLSGSIRDADGLPLPVVQFALASLDDPSITYYFTTYEEPGLAAGSPFGENFAFGDVPAGSYELSFVLYSLERHTIEIRAGERTFLDLVVGSDG